MLPKILMSLFVALIHEVEPLMELRDFKPISLIGSLYNLATKVLVVMATDLMRKLIYVEKSTFLRGCSWWNERSPLTRF